MVRPGQGRRGRRRPGWGRWGRRRPGGGRRPGAPRVGRGSGPGFRGRNGEWGNHPGRKVVPQAGHEYRRPWACAPLQAGCRSRGRSVYPHRAAPLLFGRDAAGGRPASASLEERCRRDVEWRGEDENRRGGRESNREKGGRKKRLFVPWRAMRGGARGLPCSLRARSPCRFRRLHCVPWTHSPHAARRRGVTLGLVGRGCESGPSRLLAAFLTDRRRASPAPARRDTPPGEPSGLLARAPSPLAATGEGLCDRSLAGFSEGSPRGAPEG